MTLESHFTDLWISGVSVQKICDTLGITKHRVAKMRDALGLPSRQKKGHPRAAEKPADAQPVIDYCLRCEKRLCTGDCIERQIVAEEVERRG